MATDAPVVESPTVNVRGEKGEVVRVAPAVRAKAFPVAMSSVVDVWVMPRGMHFAVIEGADGKYVFVLAYVDDKVRDACTANGLHASLAVDIWHFQPLTRVQGSAQVRTLCRHIAHAAADGAVDFEPIRPGQRAVWDAAVSALEALVTRPTPDPVRGRPADHGIWVDTEDGTRNPQV